MSPTTRRGRPFFQAFIDPLFFRRHQRQCLPQVCLYLLLREKHRMRLVLEPVIDQFACSTPGVNSTVIRSDGPCQDAKSPSKSEKPALSTVSMLPLLGYGPLL